MAGGGGRVSGMDGRERLAGVPTTGQTQNFSHLGSANKRKNPRTMFPFAATPAPPSPTPGVLLVIPILVVVFAFVRVLLRAARQLNTGSTPGESARSAFTSRYDAAFNPEAAKGSGRIGGAPAAGGMTEAPTDGGVPAVVDQARFFLFFSLQASGQPPDDLTLSHPHTHLREIHTQHTPNTQHNTRHSSTTSSPARTSGGGARPSTFLRLTRTARAAPASARPRTKAAWPGCWPWARAGPSWTAGAGWAGPCAWWRR
jgi:hypothetical protein